jgi:hypothetical protein
MDAVQVAAGYGIPAARAMKFRASEAGVRSSYSSLSRAMARGRRGEAYGFTEEERAAALDEE